MTTIQNISEFPIDNQVEIILNFGFEDLMSLLDTYPMIQINKSLWEKVVHKSKIPIDQEKLKKMSYHYYYMEHLIEQKNTKITCSYISRIPVFYFKTNVETKFVMSGTSDEYLIEAVTKLIKAGDENKSYEIELDVENEYIILKNDIVHFCNNLNSPEELEEEYNNSVTLKVPFSKCREMFNDFIDRVKEELNKIEEKIKTVQNDDSPRLLSNSPVYNTNCPGYTGRLQFPIRRR